MIEVEEIELNITLPADGIGMVIMQPFVELCDYEPYRWQNNKKNKQMERIVRIFEIAKQADHGCEKTHFTILPEYAIPGLEGIAKIEEVLNSSLWMNGTIVIGGLDGLTKSEYCNLCSGESTEVHQENNVERVRDDQWVNCYITWVKNADGSLKRWVQPKLLPATQEELCPASRMFEGRAVYVFRPKISLQDSVLPFRFLTFICKDWIGNIGNLYAVDLVLRKLDELRNITGERIDISLTLVLERNDRPGHDMFLQRTVQYINEENYPGVRRSEGAILFVNSAGKDGPGNCEIFGYSGFIYHPNCSFLSHDKYCPPTYTLKTRAGLTHCKEARFRENGSCILSLKLLPPILPIVRRMPSTPRIPINPAIVYSIETIGEGVEGDPRAPGKEVPASIKWVNDCLDEITPLLEHEREHPIRKKIKNIHDAVCREIRKESDKFLCSYIKMASCGIEKEKEKWIEIGERIIYNVDNWDENEEHSLETVIYSLSIIKACMPVEVKDSFAHGSIRIQDKVFDIIIVYGKTHEECFEHSKIQYLGSGQRFVIVVTRDIHNTSWDQKFRSILEDLETSTKKDPNITNPDSRFYHCGYQNLISNCFNSQNLTELNIKIKEVIRV